MDKGKKTDVKQMSMEELGKGIDREMAAAGLVIGDLFKTVSIAATHLPNMELHTDVLHVTVDEDSISVTVSGLSSGHRHFEDEGVDDGEYGYGEDDEEERIYDEL